jgi:hypothetical protein
MLCKVSLHCTLLLNQRNLAELPQWLQPEKPFMLRRLEIVGTEVLLDSCSLANARHWSVIQNADHVYANLPDGSYFYTKSSGNIHRSVRSLAQSSLHITPSFRMPIAPHVEDAVSTDEVISSNGQIGQPRRNQSYIYNSSVCCCPYIFLAN